MNSPSENRLKRLIREVHRRSLWQVLGIYLAASWIAYEVAQGLTEGLGLRRWLPGVALVLLIIGLPIVLATAFVQEGGPEVSSVDPVADLEDIPSGDSCDEPRGVIRRLFNWRNAMLGGGAAFVLLLTVALSWFTFGQRSLSETFDGAFQAVGEEGAIEPSLAVMPCDDLSPSGDQAALAQGIADEVSMALSQLPGLKVSGRSSVLAMRAQEADLATISNTLGVANVLQCTVVRDASAVRVNALLTDAETGSVLWSAQFNEEFTNLFGLLDAVARGINRELRMALVEEETLTLVSEATEVPEAHEAYLRGRYFWSQRTGDALEAAIEEFETAVALDPEFSEAWVGLADALILMPEYGGVTSPVDWTQRCIEAARRALSIDPDLGVAHAPLGFGLHVLGAWDEAKEELAQAITLTPGNATAHQWYGMVHYTTGRTQEGLVHSRMARDLDPVSRIASANLGRALRTAGLIEEAIDQFRHTTELAPDWPTGWIDLGVALLDTGQYEEGLDAWLRGASLFQADVSAWEGDYRAAIRHQETGEPQTAPRFRGAMPRIALAAKTGDREFLFEVLEEAAQLGTLAWVSTAHVNHGARVHMDDPRYQALLEAVGITW